MALGAGCNSGGTRAGDGGDGTGGRGTGTGGDGAGGDTGTGGAIVSSTGGRIATDDAGGDAAPPADDAPDARDAAPTDATIADATDARDAGGPGDAPAADTRDAAPSDAAVAAERPAMSGRAASIAAGDWWHTCAVLDTGAVRCWGQATDGVLGYGNLEDIGDDEYPASAGDVPVGAPVVQMAVGRSHACALLATGGVRCWGANTDGQLGYNDTTPRSRPPTTNVNVGGRVTQLCASETHTCALLEGGTVRCWGYNAFGALGYGDSKTPDGKTYLYPPGDIDVGGPVTQIACGGENTCAILASGGLRCWGSGILGRLGYGNETDIGDDETPASAGDVPVGGKVVHVALSFTHTCAVLEGGGVRCWGYGGLGELGYGNGTNDIGDDETPASMGDVPVGGPARMVAVGRWHSCALLTTGAVRCWGHALQAELGYGNGNVTNDIGDNETPASAGDVDIGAVPTTIAAGLEHTCVIIPGGAVRCWGSPSFGALGYGNENPIGDDETPASAGDVPF